MYGKILLAALGLPLLLGAETVAENKDQIMESGGQALIVRSAAIGSPRGALEKWLKPEAAAEFARLTAGTFENSRSYELSDFFNTSLILAGSQSEESGITAFYSPWQDAILLVRTTGKGVDRRGAEFLFLTGETFRGEKFADSLEVVTPEKSPLSVNLWRVYSGTLARFNALFPASGAADLEGLKKGVDQTAEFANIRLRSLARTLLAKKLVTEPYRVPLANCLIALRALQRGDEATLKKVFGEKDELGQIAGFAKVPKEIRTNIEPVYSLATEKGSLFGFINPGAPRFVFLAHVDGENKFTLEWFDFEESAGLYKAWEEAK